MWSLSRAERQNHLPQPADHAAFDAFGYLACKCTWQGHVQPIVHQHPQALLGQAALGLFIPQPVLIPMAALAQVQHLALGLIKPHEIPMFPLLDLVQVPLGGIPSLMRVNSTTKLGVIFMESN